MTGEPLALFFIVGLVDLLTQSIQRFLDSLRDLSFFTSRDFFTRFNVLSIWCGVSGFAR